MLPADYVTQNCSIARSLELVGERWTILIIRDAFLGTRRFDQFQERLGIARNVLQTRLERLVEAGILRREPYQQRPVRYEYRLTSKGVDLWPVVIALLQWGDRYAAPDGAPVVIEHKGCGGAIDDRRRCTRCGADLGPGDVQARPGPGGGTLPVAAGRIPVADAVPVADDALAVAGGRIPVADALPVADDALALADAHPVADDAAGPDSGKSLRM
jgi:DNA-binding HxlR family transcriptional regulator